MKYSASLFLVASLVTTAQGFVVLPTSADVIALNADAFEEDDFDGTVLHFQNGIFLMLPSALKLWFLILLIAFSSSGSCHRGRECRQEPQEDRHWIWLATQISGGCLRGEEGCRRWRFYHGRRVLSRKGWWFGRMRRLWSTQHSLSVNHGAIASCNSHTELPAADMPTLHLQQKGSLHSTLVECLLFPTSTISMVQQTTILESTTSSLELERVINSLSPLIMC